MYLLLLTELVQWIAKTSIKSLYALAWLSVIECMKIDMLKVEPKVFEKDTKNYSYQRGINIM